MSALRLLLGFIVGVIACGILIGLISIRVPILASGAVIVSKTVNVAENANPKSAEQNGNIENAVIEDEKKPDEPVATEPDQPAQVPEPEIVTAQEEEEPVQSAEPEEPEPAETTQPTPVEPADATEEQSQPAEPVVAEPVVKDTPESPVAEAEADEPKATEPPEDQGEVETVVEQVPENPVVTEPEPEVVTPVEPADTAEQADPTPIPSQPTVPDPIPELDTAQLPEPPSMSAIGENADDSSETAGAGTTPNLPSVDTSSSGSRFKLDSEGVEVEAESLAATLKTDYFARNSNPAITDDKPLFSIVLQDIGSLGAPQADLLKLPKAFSFAVPATFADATKISKSYRGEGFEILALMPDADSSGLSQFSSETQALLAAYFTNVPSAVAILDGTQGNLQKNRSVFVPFIETLDTFGAGLLTYNRGINGTVREAQKLDMPAGMVFRVLDDNNEDFATIERGLDRAVLEANQEGAVIVVGKASTSTIAAIQSWLESPRAMNVTLAPVTSAIQKLSN